MKHNQTIVGFILAICFLSACNSRPSYVLSDAQMEDVLYDLYIAEVGMDENSYFFNNDSVRKQELLSSVFKKHNITEQAFDTSLVWYNKNLDRYLRINTKVDGRLTVLADTLKKQIDFMEEEIRLASIQELFPDVTFFFLRSPGLFQNRHTFKTDTLHHKDYRNLNLNFDVLGINDSIYPIVSLYIECTDTIIIHCDTIRTNIHYSKSFSIPSKNKLSKVHGSFQIPDEEKALILFNNVSVSTQDNSILNSLPKTVSPTREPNRTVRLAR